MAGSIYVVVIFLALLCIVFSAKCDFFARNTTISSNVFAQVTTLKPPANDPNHHVAISIYDGTQTELWTVLLSSATTSVSLTHNKENNGVLLFAGFSLSIKFNGIYGDLVSLDGALKDDSANYNLTGLVLGNFNCKESNEKIKVPSIHPSSCSNSGNSSAISLTPSLTIIGSTSSDSSHSLLPSSGISIRLQSGEDPGMFWSAILSLGIYDIR